MKNKIITLCGSTKYKDHFELINKQLTLEGYLIFSCGFFTHKDNIKITNDEKNRLDILHKNKILKSDSIFVIDVDNYIGESTQSEINYAKENNKIIKYYSNMPDLQLICNNQLYKKNNKDELSEYIESAIVNSIMKVKHGQVTTKQAIDFLKKEIQFKTVDRKKCKVSSNIFNKIREWANQRDLYDKGDIKTQVIKLQEEVGELSKAILKNNLKEIKDGIGDSVVVLTNLAELVDKHFYDENNIQLKINIESCILHAYDEIRNRKGKMINGTFEKKYI